MEQCKEKQNADLGFNVAGLSKSGLIMDQDYKDWKTTVDIVLDGVFLAMKQER